MTKFVPYKLLIILIIPVIFGEYTLADSIKDRSRSQKWSPEARFRFATSNRRSLGQIDLFAPLAQNNTSLLFLDLRFWRDTKNTTEGNYGLAFRKLHPSLGWIFGGYGFFDNRLSEHNNIFQQVTLGLEVLSEIWEIRVNTYTPFSKSKTLPHSRHKPTKVFFRGHEEYFNTQKEVALKGFDAEVGRLIPSTENFRLYVGGFHFQKTGARKIKGVRARLTWSINDYIDIEGDYEYDNIRHSVPFFWLTLRVPFGEEGMDTKLTPLEHRMQEVIIRDIDIVTQKQKIPTATGRKFIFSSIEGQGNGTFEYPVNRKNQEIVLSLLKKHPKYFYYDLGTGTIVTGKKQIEYIKERQKLSRPLSSQPLKEPSVIQIPEPSIKVPPKVPHEAEIEPIAEPALITPEEITDSAIEPRSLTIQPEIINETEVNPIVTAVPASVLEEDIGDTIEARSLVIQPEISNEANVESFVTDVAGPLIESPPDSVIKPEIGMIQPLTQPVIANEVEVNPIIKSVAEIAIHVPLEFVLEIDLQVVNPQLTKKSLQQEELEITGRPMFSQQNIQAFEKKEDLISQIPKPIGITQIIETLISKKPSKIESGLGDLDSPPIRPISSPVQTSKIESGIFADLNSPVVTPTSTPTKNFNIESGIFGDLNTPTISPISSPKQTSKIEPGIFADLNSPVVTPTSTPTKNFNIDSETFGGLNNPASSLQIGKYNLEKIKKKLFDAQVPQGKEKIFTK